MRSLRRWNRLAGLALVALVAVACQATAAPAPSASSSGAAATKLFLMVDLVQGTKNIPAAQAASKGCVLNSRFPRNSELVWRARVYDPKTGDLMDDKALSSVQVKLANGKTVDMKYGAHPKDPPNESYWTGSWDVPKDAPTGTLKFSVVATAADGRNGDFEPFSVVPSLPTITDEVYDDAPAK